MSSGLLLFFLEKKAHLKRESIIRHSLSVYRPEKSQVHYMRGELHQTFMKWQKDIINLSSPSVVNMLGCGGRLYSDHSRNLHPKVNK